MTAHKRYVLILLFIDILLFVLAKLIAIYPIQFGMCASRYTNSGRTELYDCFQIKAESLIYSTGHFSIVLIPLLFILFFSRREVFFSWVGFLAICMPLIILFVLITPAQCSAPLDLCLDRVDTSFLLSILFLIISFSIIAIESWKLRGKPDKKGS